MNNNLNNYNNNIKTKLHFYCNNILVLKLNLKINNLRYCYLSSKITDNKIVSCFLRIIKSLRVAKLDSAAVIIFFPIESFILMW